MKIYVMTDSHLGHDKLPDYGVRAPGFYNEILAGLRKTSGDLLIHTGDVCIGNDRENHTKLLEAAAGFKKKILVRGNHDGKSYAWYYGVGWDVVVESMRMRVNGKEVLFTHMPVLAENTLYTPYLKLDHNIHGHLHGRGKYSHRKVEGYQEGYHIDIAPEIYGYTPVNLEKILCK